MMEHMDDLSEDETAEYNDESDNAENQEENYTHERYPVSKKKNGTRINSTPPSRRRKSSQKVRRLRKMGRLDFYTVWICRIGHYPSISIFMTEPTKTVNAGLQFRQFQKK